ncbi:FmdB family transcriptional regulator [Brucepastera parasyntrophica]|uniref:FmdB family zinc ribbon protein n=1 Tax=Brucepastera parasyntrophica TaxID=2880008 RepID=UPI00210C1004|nr:FmdB family zinc ribbon protein [Brucepastera parasyntrophica]ULQ59864.1 FmdB family transcriptional regulator [Brucepastera parasyntrophica]
MPTYEYACDSCNNNFEVFQKMSDEPVKVCPKCGENVRRVLSGGIGISFKGSGFYVNDSRPAEKKETAPSSKPADCSACASK